jgi:hypothetical protein
VRVQEETPPNNAPGFVGLRRIIACLDYIDEAMLRRRYPQ